MAVKNGAISVTNLLKLSTTGYLVPAAARSYERMAKEFEKATGMKLRPSSTYDTYRPYAVQERLFRERYTTTLLSGRPRKWWNGRWWYLRPGHAHAAVPGTSNHGFGVAVDFAGLGGFGGKGYAWLKANAGRHGWNNDEGRKINEPWHWVYEAAQDRYPWRKISVTGRFDLATRYALQRVVGRPVTSATSKAGLVGLWKAIQRRLNAKLKGVKGFVALKIDGDPGPRTIRALQTHLRRVVLIGRPKVDGVAGPVTYKALQRALNSKKF